jgi:hypothetical protein
MTKHLLVLLTCGGALAGCSGMSATQQQALSGTAIGPVGYDAGFQDRSRWETWFSQLTGQYQRGAEYWANQRSLPNPGGCQTTDPDFSLGCVTAQGRLNSTEWRFKNDPDYRLGWNAWTAPFSTTPPTARGLGGPLQPTPGVTPGVQSGPPSQAAPQAQAQANEVALRLRGNTFYVPVTINNSIQLDFLIDSGASDVTIPADVAGTLMRTGTLASGDLLGRENYQLADGSTLHSTTFRIRSLKVGDRTLHDVVGSIAPVQGSLLLGQSFLRHFRSWSIDNNRRVLRLE